MATAKLLRRLHKYLRILLQPFLNTGVSFQKLLEFGMIFLEFLAVGQPGIVGKLLRNNRMTAKEFTEVIHIPASRIVIAVVLDPVEAPFLPPEEKIETLYLSVLSRWPRQSEKQFLLEHLERQAARPDEKSAYAEIMWGLLNSPEFVLCK